MKNRILLFGETGDGKSSFINAFFGKNVAPVSKDAKKCTKYVTPYKDQRGNETYTLIDTPGLNDIEKKRKRIKRKL